MAFGAALQSDAESEPERYDCPSNLALVTENIRSVQTYTGATWFEAYRLWQENPLLFSHLLSCTNAARESEALQLKTMQEEAKNQAGHNDAASLPR